MNRPGARRSLALAVVLLSLCSVSSAIVESGAEGLKARHDRSIATSQGRQYEEGAVRRFWGDARFMQECAPKGSPIAEPLTIYFEVGADGRMGRLLITPETAVGKCIRGHVLGRRFDAPPAGDFVVKIDLEFRE